MASKKRQSETPGAPAGASAIEAKIRAAFKAYLQEPDYIRLDYVRQTIQFSKWERDILERKLAIIADESTTTICLKA
jgi:hypothetical protein